jgi:hypothetical protein
MRSRGVKKLLFVFALVGLTACASKQTAGPTEVRTQTINDGGAVLMAELTYEPKGPRQVQLVLSLRVSGMEETDKLVSTVLIKGFNVADGSLRWTGFVPPRQPQIHTVTLEVPEGINEAVATVTLQRSVDSEVMLQEELAIAVAENGAITVTVQ